MHNTASATFGVTRPLRIDPAGAGSDTARAASCSMRTSSQLRPPTTHCDIRGQVAPRQVVAGRGLKTGRQHLVRAAPESPHFDDHQRAMARLLQQHPPPCCRWWGRGLSALPALPAQEFGPRVVPPATAPGVDFAAAEGAVQMLPACARSTGTCPPGPAPDAPAGRFGHPQGPVPRPVRPQNRTGRGTGLGALMRRLPPRSIAYRSSTPRTRACPGGCSGGCGDHDHPQG